MSSYTIDTSHSEIGFSVRHMMFAKVRGQFKSWSATLSYDPVDPTASKIRVEVDTNSIDTREEKRDAHLRSADFFDTEKYPKIVFESQRIESAGEGRYRVIGNLTIKDVTREVTLEAEQTGSGKDPWGNNRLGFNATTALDRSNWGLKWNQALETGGVLVSDKVEIQVETQVVESK